jgi:hypothetical protein
VKLFARSALTRVQSFISEISRGLTIVPFSQKFNLSTGAVQGVHRPREVSVFAN